MAVPTRDDPGACQTNARLLRPPQLGIFLRSFPLNRPPLFAGNDRRKLLDLGRPRYGDHYSDRLLALPRHRSVSFAAMKKFQRLFPATALALAVVACNPTSPPPPAAQPSADER